MTAAYAVRLAQALGLGLAQLRWCHAPGCRTFALAVDEWQRSALDRAGFGRCCPTCGEGR